MPDYAALERSLRRIDGTSYRAYRDIEGTWTRGDRTLFVDHVQGDPYAAPSRLRVRLPIRLPQLEDRDARDATEDWLLRSFANNLRGGVRTGSGRSGELGVLRVGPEIRERSACRVLRDGQVELRFTAGLPARGRRVLGRQAWQLLDHAVHEALDHIRPDESLASHIASVRRQRALRRALGKAGLAAFIGNGAILPRASGVDQRPLRGAVPFRSPQSLEVCLQTPEGPVRGLGIPRGVTLIVGGGFHGKSTVLQALQRGHLDHVPGDGRELVVTDPTTAKVRAEDGRSVCEVDISPLLRDLPGNRTTSSFSTADASGSTSQAAAIIEAVEAGARVLLLDEDTSATNLLVRDERMRALIPRESEPIVPFVERVRQLHEVWGVSTILVVGGVGDYLSVADTVLSMEDWEAHDATTRAQAIAGPRPEPPDALAPIAPRTFLRRGLEPGKIRARSRGQLSYGDTDIALGAVEQLLCTPETRTVGEALRFLHDELIDERRDLRQLLAALDAILDDEGIEALAPRRYPPGDLVRPRMLEVAAALSRVRGLRRTR